MKIHGVVSCRYEVGKWRHIQKDSEFGPILKNRSNVDLKDKWRNLNMDSGGSRRDSRGGGGERVSFFVLSHLWRGTYRAENTTRGHVGVGGAKHALVFDRYLPLRTMQFSAGCQELRMGDGNQILQAFVFIGFMKH